ncbi:MAG: amidohydrolase family protein, partial [Pseudomonadota bacterium]
MKWIGLGLLFSVVSLAQSTLFFNGKIISSFSLFENPVSELFVKDGKVQNAGNQLEVPPGTRRVDLQGKWVYPALADAHVHLFPTGQEKKQLNLRGKSLEEIRTLLLEALTKKPRILFGFGWDQNLWPNKAFPEISFLDSISNKIPIILFRIDGHAAWANSVALQKAGLIKKALVVDVGMEKLQKLIPLSSEKEMEEEIMLVINQALKTGVTSLHDAGISKREFEVLRKVIKNRNLPFRFYEMASSTDRKELEQ